MPSEQSTSPTRKASDAFFHTTHWSVVLAAGEQGAPEAGVALEALCSSYWYPLYAWLRRQGHAPHDAQDLTQGFFVYLLGHDGLHTIRRDKGRFRSFLLASLKHFVANEWDRTNALKRGGAVSFVPWDDAGAEERFQRLSSPVLPPDQAFEQTWSTTLLELVLARLRAEYVREGDGERFGVLQVYLTGDRGAVPYADSASRLNLSESAVKMAIQRLRRRFGEVLRHEIAHTVSRPEEIDDEIRALFAAVRL